LQVYPANQCRGFGFGRRTLEAALAKVPEPIVANGFEILTACQQSGADPQDPATIFDHTSILATVEERFNLSPLPARDKVANKLDVVLHLDAPRADAPTDLQSPSPFGSAPVT
jgi:hypothetical protein